MVSLEEQLSTYIPSLRERVARLIYPDNPQQWERVPSYQEVFYTAAQQSGVIQGARNAKTLADLAAHFYTSLPAGMSHGDAFSSPGAMRFAYGIDPFDFYQGLLTGFNGRVSPAKEKRHLIRKTADLVRENVLADLRNGKEGFLTYREINGAMSTAAELFMRAAYGPRTLERYAQDFLHAFFETRIPLPGVSENPFQPIVYEMTVDMLRDPKYTASDVIRTRAVNALEEYERFKKHSVKAGRLIAQAFTVNPALGQEYIQRLFA